MNRIYGMVIYAGNDTKSLLNLNKEKNVSSFVEKYVSYFILLIIAISILLAIVFS